MFLAVVVAVIFVSASLFGSWQPFIQPLQASQSKAFDRASASGQSIILPSISPLAASENGGFASLMLSDVSDDANEDDRTFYASMVLGMLCFLVIPLWDARFLLAEREESTKPYYRLYCSVLERPD